MFKLASVIAAIAIAFLVTRDPSTSSGDSKANTVEVSAAVLRIRADPSTSAKVITSRPRGTKLTVLEERNCWLRVSDAKLTSGWVGTSGVE